MKPRRFSAALLRERGGSHLLPGDNSVAPSGMIE
jgi:hypothetical protein